MVDTDRKADTVSTMDEGKRQKRPRRSFTDEFKAGAVRLVLDEGKTFGVSRFPRFSMERTARTNPSRWIEGQSIQEKSDGFLDSVDPSDQSGVGRQPLIHR